MSTSTTSPTTPAGESCTSPSEEREVEGEDRISVERRETRATNQLLLLSRNVAINHSGWGGGSAGTQKRRVLVRKVQGEGEEKEKTIDGIITSRCFPSSFLPLPSTPMSKAVEACIAEGARMECIVSGVRHSILGQWIRLGAVEVVSACLRRYPHPLFFGASFLLLLQALEDEVIEREECLYMLEWMVWRLETHPLDDVNWSSREPKHGRNVVEFAAWIGVLAPVWCSIQDFAFFADKAVPLSSASNVNNTAFNAPSSPHSLTCSPSPTTKFLLRRVYMEDWAAVPEDDRETYFDISRAMIL